MLFSFFLLQFGALSAFTIIACRFDRRQHFECHETLSHHVLHEYDDTCGCHSGERCDEIHKRVKQPISISLGTFCVCKFANRNLICRFHFFFHSFSFVAIHFSGVHRVRSRIESSFGVLKLKREREL